MNATEYRERQASLARETEAAVASLFVVYSAPEKPFTAAEFAGIVGMVVANANTRAAVLADVFQSGRLRLKPQGITRPDVEPEVLADAVNEVLADTDEPLPRLRRLARSEPVQSSRQAARQVLADHGVKSYRWQLSSNDPCGLCRFLAKRSWPVTKVPFSHPSCSCQIVPA